MILFAACTAVEPSGNTGERELDFIEPVAVSDDGFFSKERILIESTEYISTISIPDEIVERKGNVIGVYSDGDGYFYISKENEIVMPIAASLKRYCSRLKTR